MPRIACSLVVLAAWSCTPPADKGGWVEEKSNSAADLYGLHAFQRDRVLAVGSGGKTVALVDGTWRERLISGDDTLRAVWGSSENDVFIVGGVPGRGIAWHTGQGFFQYSGMTLPNGTPMLYAVHGTRHEDVWAVGDNNTALHFDGTVFAPVAVPTPAPLTGVDLRGVYCRQQDDCWAVGLDGVTAHWDGAQWTSQISAPSTTLTSIHGVGDSILMAGDKGTLLTVISQHVGTVGSPDHSRMLEVVWMAAANDAWAMGDASDGVHALVLHQEGTADWAAAKNPDVERTVRAIHGVDGNLLWAVGDQGTIFRRGAP